MHEIKELIQKAMDARMHAYAPYSNFLVGCVLECEDGRLFTGCNIENAAFGPSNCAERTAFFSAINEGATQFRRIVIVGGKRNSSLEQCSPCGICRQVMAEFCDDSFEIIMARSENDFCQMSLGDLLPMHFGKHNLEDN